ncbi:uncharacterized protein LOC122858235 isoform X2 [Aphidius gifuensis]|uniref:uncharacterized protein LOC122858235 isoform X2 n=1 Tax=Aphidius gifuensis TaxID=684658 RepID=UPI001CDBF734|nr:uncharacterized protein LOC122858235 isoform X2 [Aphidius gifuensis]
MKHKKCGFCQYIGFPLKNKKSKIENWACNLCNHYSMGSSIYVILFGLIGTVITAFDIIRIVKCQVPERFNARQRSRNIVPQDIERDLKLMTSILGIEHYTQIMLGAITIGVSNAICPLAFDAIMSNDR